MIIEAGESQSGGSETGSGADDAAASDAGSREVDGANAGGRAMRRGAGDESVASYARIAPRPPRQRPTRSELLGGGDASKAPKRLTDGELHPIEGDSSGHSWDDPEEL